jgi:hypothetical protein
MNFAISGCSVVDRRPGLMLRGGFSRRRESSRK